MRKTKSDGEKLNNSGFSLVEFLIAVAILGVVSLTIYSFMNTGARFYQRTSADADIQSEAQLVANTISDLIVDCEVNISYDNTITNAISGSGGSVILLNGRVLEISNSDYQFIIFHQDTNLFYLERRPKASDPSQYEAYNLDNAELLAQNITEFEVDLSRVSGKGKGKNIVTFVMTYEKGGRSYRGNYQVNLRNAITVSANNITPSTDDPNLTKIMVTPSPVFIEIKGKDNPHLACNNSCTDHTHCPANQETKEFTANSDATNVGRTNIFQWRIEDANGPVTTYAQPEGDTTNKRFTIRFGNDLRNVPSNFRVIAESTIPNKDTGICATGEAIVYFKKILNLNITPTRGVTGDKMDPQSSAIFQANFSDYNLNAEDKRCTWVLEYKKGSEEDFKPCNSSSIATGRSFGSTYSVQLGKDADEFYTFRLRATSNWDGTWSAEYVFGVTEKEKIPGIDSPSRGVEIDMTAYFLTDQGAKYGKDTLATLTDEYKTGLTAIIDFDIENFSNHDVDGVLFKIIRDGKAYLYLDYGAMRYTEGTRALEFYDNPNIHLVNVRYIDSNGVERFKQSVNIAMSPASISASEPAANSSILISPGSGYDVTFSTEGYNISKKNQIGIYFADNVQEPENPSRENLENVNANEIGMLDLNPYLTVNYIGDVGNRYKLVQSGIFRLNVRPGLTSYPTDRIAMRVGIDDFYRLVRSYWNGAGARYSTRSHYGFNVYISNVEGCDLFVQGPEDINNYTTAKVVYKTGEGSNAEVAMVSVVPDTDIAVGNDTIKFTPVKRGNEKDAPISFYQMKYRGREYYYNVTYHCWKPVS